MEYYEWIVILKTNLNRRKFQKIEQKGIEPRTYIQVLATDRSTTRPTGHSLVAAVQSSPITCTMLTYIYNARVIARLLVSTGFGRVPVRRFCAHGIVEFRSVQ